jgi:ectoine hydroxylase-related dioxygenase (phytanoyl-CoA dioxygenase family)
MKSEGLHPFSLLDQDGFAPLGVLLDGKELNALRSRVSELQQAEGDRCGHELFDPKHIRHPREEGADRIANLVNKGVVFDILYTHPALLAAIRHVLGPDIRLSSLNFRSAKPGQGLQKLHVDWHEAVGAGDFKVCNSIWLLDDFTPENGATRVVPRSHLTGQLPADEMEEPLSTHPDETLIQGPAGSCFIFNAHTWQGGTANRTPFPRRAIHSYFCRRDQPQQTDQRKWVTKETLGRISPEARWLLDV